MDGTVAGFCKDQYKRLQENIAGLHPAWVMLGRKLSGLAYLGYEKPTSVAISRGHIDS